MVSPRGTNFYFNNFSSSAEQLLIENLVIESIKIYGQDMYYIPRNVQNRDDVLTDDKYSTFDSAYPIEMYIKNVEGFEGEGDFLSKFGLEIRDRMTFTVARRIFGDEVISATTLTRPREGDLIFFPLNGKLFEIKFVEHESIFYQLGSLQTYDLICDLYEYNNETFNTGIGLIDSRYNALDRDMGTANTADYNLQDIDSQAQNEIFETEGDAVLDFTELNPFGDQDY